MGTRKAQPAREPGFIYYHGHRTGNIARHLAGLLGADVDLNVLYVGALFHDIGKGEEPHQETGAATTAELVADRCTPQELDAIRGIVRNHNQRHRAADCSLDQRIVQDADLIDHVGFICPWLAFYWSGTHNEPFHDHVRFMKSDENEKYRTGMRNALNFEESRCLFDERVTMEKQFFADFHRVYLDGI